MTTTRTLLRRLKRLEERCAAPQVWSVPLDPVEMAQEAGVTLDEWQADMVRSTSDRQILNCSRQSGKSTAASVLAVHTCLAEQNALALLVSPSLRQSAELFRSCKRVYQALGQTVQPKQESALRLELQNGSRIVSLPGTEATIRGFAGVRLLIIDEASRVPTDVYMALRPMLAVSGGRLVTLSTPFGSRGWWYEAYRNRHEWDYYEVPATSCNRISPAFLAEEKRTIGQWWYEQEYLCRFLDAQTAAFRSEDLEKILDPEVELWQL